MPRKRKCGEMSHNVTKETSELIKLQIKYKNIINQEDVQLTPSTDSIFQGSGICRNNFMNYHPS